jgi:hypothetical protein
MTNKVVFDTSFAFNSDNNLLVDTPVISLNHDFSLSCNFTADWISNPMDIQPYTEPGDIIQIVPY